MEPFSDIDGFKPYMMTSGVSLRRLMLKNGFEWRCYECGITEWRGIKAPLHVDHINGVRENNTRSNLRFLCPNCHALTETYCGRNTVNKQKSIFTDELIVSTYRELVEHGISPSASYLIKYTGRYPRTYWITQVKEVCLKEGLGLRARKTIADRHYECKILWPSRDDLNEMLKEMPRSAVAGLLGVSDNAVKKHCLKIGISEPDTHRRLPRDDEQLKRCNEMLTKVRTDRLRDCHGTVKGYNLELELGLPTCDECRVAWAESARNKRRRRK